MYLLVRGPGGRPVELTWNAWSHVRKRHPEMAQSLLDIVLTIEHPHYSQPDVQPGRERLFRRAGSDRWIRVVLEFHGDFDVVVTAFSQAVDPRLGHRP
jgi:hypothetical protein